jgi:hypothetical protein
MTVLSRQPDPSELFVDQNPARGDQALGILFGHPLVPKQFKTADN